MPQVMLRQSCLVEFMYLFVVYSLFNSRMQGNGMYIIADTTNIRLSKENASKK